MDTREGFTRNDVIQRIIDKQDQLTPDRPVQPETSRHAHTPPRRTQRPSPTVDRAHTPVYFDIGVGKPCPKNHISILAKGKRIVRSDGHPCSTTSRRFPFVRAVKDRRGHVRPLGIQCGIGCRLSIGRQGTHEEN